MPSAGFPGSSPAQPGRPQRAGITIILEGNRLLIHSAHEPPLAFFLEACEYRAELFAFLSKPHVSLDMEKPRGRYVYPIYSRPTWRDGMPEDPNEAFVQWRPGFHARERKELPYSRARGAPVDNVVSFHREVFRIWSQRCDAIERREAAIEEWDGGAA